MKELKFTLSIEEYNKFLDIIQELNKVSDIHKIKWMKNSILIYSVLAEGQKVNAVKLFQLNKENIFVNFPDDVELVYVLKDAKEWTKKFKMLSDDNESIEVTLRYKEDMKAIYTFGAKNSVLEFNAVGGDDKVIKDIPETFFKNNMNIKTADWSMVLSEEIIKRTKKLSKLDDTEAVKIYANKGDVSFKDTSWNLKLVNNPAAQGSWLFKKDHLDRVTLWGETIEIGIFSSYILVIEKESSFLFTLDLME